MAEITAAAVNALRKKTDLPMMECKKALTEAGGDEAKAMQILKDMFKKVQDKRADNVTAEGRVFLAVKPDGSEAAMVEIQCESAPVATGEVMKQFGQAMVFQVKPFGHAAMGDVAIFHAILEGQPGQVTIELVSPLMIGANKGSSVAMRCLAKTHATMGAAVFKRVDRTIRIARDDDGRIAHKRRAVIARLWNVALKT